MDTEVQKLKERESNLINENQSISEKMVEVEKDRALLRSEIKKMQSKLDHQNSNDDDQVSKNDSNDSYPGMCHLLLFLFHGTH